MDFNFELGGPRKVFNVRAYYSMDAANKDNRRMDDFLDGSDELHIAILQLLEGVQPHGGIRHEVASVGCAMAMEHALSLRLLVKTACYMSIAVRSAHQVGVALICGYRFAGRNPVRSVEPPVLPDLIARPN